MTALRPLVAAALAAMGCALAPVTASAGPNLVINGDFSSFVGNMFTNPPTNWTLNKSNGGGYLYTGIDGQFINNVFTTFYFAQVYCDIQCAPNTPVSMSQTIGSLITGHQYQLKYMVAGSKTEQTLDETQTQYYVDSDLLHVEFDGVATAPLYTVAPNVPYPTHTISWQNAMNTFTYTGTSGTAELSFVQQLTSYTSGCVPCGQAEVVANVSLIDLGSGGGGSASEPGTLAMVALALGLLGRVGYRRRQGLA